jgi:hypothetical protein
MYFLYARTMRAGAATAGALLLIYLTCGWKIFLPASRRAQIDLKNRAAIPALSDYDPAVTLAAMLQPGDDRARFSASRAARVEGYVLAVWDANPEAANCFSLRRRDTHIELALAADAPPRARVTVEVTPRVRDWAARQGLDWSEAALRRTLIGRLVRISGWLFYDAAHADESENTRPGDEDNWRATAWEIHPVTAIDVIDDGRQGRYLNGRVMRAISRSPDSTRACAR